MKRRSWRQYHNSQKYSDCQLISAINAHYYWYGKRIDQDSEEYESLVDLVSARHGGAISIEKAHKKLGLKVLWEGSSTTEFYEHTIKGVKYPDIYGEEDLGESGWSLVNRNETDPVKQKKIDRYKLKVDAKRKEYFKKHDLGKTCLIALPMEWSIWHPRYGFHSTLIVQASITPQARRVCNFRYATTGQGWMFEEDTYKYESGTRKDRFKLIGKTK